MNPQIAQIFSTQGPLAAQLSGYRPRAGQVAMAQAVAETLHSGHTLVAEAGTGIGKTFAYLVPALLNGGKIIVSTGTKHLQDQLYTKDLPLLIEALNLQIDAVQLKGRSNYLCHYRLKQALQSLPQRGHDDFLLLKHIEAWSERSEIGDRVEFAEIPEEHPIGPRVTSTADNCLGQDCPDYKGCFVARARRLAQEADLVVINHHLFCADLALRETGFGELLPVADGIIIDEAHQLPETAINFFGDTVSSRQLNDLAKDIVSESLKDASDMPALIELADELSLQIKRFRVPLGASGQKAAWVPQLHNSDIQAALDALIATLEEICKALDAAAVRGQGLQTCFRRSAGLLGTLRGMRAPQENHVLWFETSRLGFMLRSTPFDIADLFRRHAEQLQTAWIFTSATLAVEQDFTHFTEQLGLRDYRQGLWPSPFTYENQALLWFPQNLPYPNDPNYTVLVSALALKLIEANSGGTFFLFTSYRALQQAYEFLKTRTSKPLLVQGSDTSKQALIERFRKAGNAVLLATSSFWEGVDVRGEALSCVIIDKLPFAPPGDPVTEARLNALRGAGINPFTHYQLPKAVIALKQGVGRLIRDPSDQGLLVICDPRILSKAYGQRFLQSLPPAATTRDEAVAIEFLESL